MRLFRFEVRGACGVDTALERRMEDTQAHLYGMSQARSLRRPVAALVWCASEGAWAPMGEWQPAAYLADPDGDTWCVGPAGLVCYGKAGECMSREAVKEIARRAGTVVISDKSPAIEFANGARFRLYPKAGGYTMVLGAWRPALLALRKYRSGWA